MSIVQQVVPVPEVHLKYSPAGATPRRNSSPEHR